jgi:hypothetical protein
MFDSKTLNSEDNSAHSSPPENRNNNISIQGTPSQRVSTTVSRTNSHDLTTSAIATKTSRLTKVNHFFYPPQCRRRGDIRS